MKKIIFLLICLILNIKLFSQTVVYSDNMEDTGWTWKGIPKLLLNSYYTGGNSGAINFPINSNYYSSLDTSFSLFGTGLGSSATERDTLVYANVTGLNPSTYYRFRFKVASYALNPTVNTAAGVDNSDFIQIDYSTNGGVSYFRELKFTGNNNSRWSFNSLGSVNLGKIASGTLTTLTFSGTPVNYLTLDLPVGITQFAANIIMVTNATGESWLIDDVELVAVTMLPIELSDFSGQYLNNESQLTWITQSETNNDYFILLMSTDDQNYYEVVSIEGEGNSSIQNVYNYFYEQECLIGLLYYKLQQYDFDGTMTEYGPIAIQCPKIFIKETIKIFNMLGQVVDEHYDGLKVILYNDGTIEKKF